ncbi:homocitrate synthase/isopropylmalate synthase family protein [Desulfocurvibacter africanus]|uniref:homocitrate synthase/isopropylmalate synthase family protein n=1 Tax=Desulfocurvibacter africanus TaxID=873 RepID=UPI0003FC1950|nr:citramalate synthase [Desulfocurvibacter africanus]
MLIDSTLREGEQQFGVYFDRSHKEELLRLSLAAGVDEVEVGAVGPSPEHCRELEGLLLYGAMLKDRRQSLSLWCACRPADLRMAAGLSPDRLCMTVPVSDAHIRRKLGLDRQALLGHVARMLGLARELGVAYVSLGLEDVSRADLSFALSVARLAQDKGAARLRLADTVGVLAPAETARLVSAFRAAVNLPLALHLHNDFGMATANAVEGLRAGADFVDASALGLGERAGLASLEQIAGYLTLRLGAEGYDLATVRELCASAARAANMPVPANAPMVGERIFWCESGLHVDGLYKAAELYEPFEPSRVGLSRKLGVGKKSGRAAVARKLGELGLAACGDMQSLTDRVRALSAAKGRVLEDEELLALAK